MSASVRPFSWGIVGAGAIARQFADDLRHVPGARVGAVQTRSGNLPDGFAQMAGVAKVVSSLDELLDDSAIDAVYIATPNAAHAEQALAAISAGKPVLVEKPLATTSADARLIAEKASVAGVFAMEAMWTRFLPAMQAAREIVWSGRIGEVKSVRAELAYRREETPGSRFFDPALGGGAALDLGVYPLSVAIFLFGQPDRVEGSWRQASTGVDMASNWRLQFGQTIANLSCGFDRDGANAFVVVGTKGALRIQPPFLKAQNITVFDGWAKNLPLIGADEAGLVARLAARLPLPGRQTAAYTFPGNGLQFEAQALEQAVRAGDTMSANAPLADSIAVLEMIETIRAQQPAG